jgi:hypothetical protein
MDKLKFTVYGLEGLTIETLLGIEISIRPYPDRNKVL